MSPNPPASAGTSAEIASRVLRGTFALSLVALINFAGQLVATPITLRFWDATRYGEWLALTGLVGFLIMADLGIQPHVVNRMSAHHARGEHHALLGELHSAMRIQVPISLGLWVIAAAVAAFLPLNTILGISTASTIEVYLTVILVAMELLICVPMGAIGGTYRATGHLSRSALISAVQRAVLIVVPLVLIATGSGFSTIVLSRVVWALVISAWLIYDLPRVHGWLHFWPLGGSWKAGLRMLLPGSLFLAAGLAEYLGTQGHVAVAQTALGGTAVAHLSTHRTLVNMGKMFSALLTSALWPELTSLETVGDSSRLVRAHRTVAKLNAFLVGSVLLLFLPVSGWVYSIWTQRKLTLDGGMLALLTAQTILWSLWSGSATVLYATNRQGRLTLFLLMNAALGVGISMLVVPRMGITGSALAMLLADALCAVWLVPKIACDVIGDRLTSHAREVLPAVLMGVGVPFFVGLCLWWVLPWPSMRPLIVLPVASVLGLGLMWLALTSAERRLATLLLGRIRARFAQ